MPAASLLALLDDIATVLDDVALLTKVAAKKTAGVLGDDLALNAEQVAGVRAERELPVVWAVAKGSLRNKLILVPAALAVSAVSPLAVTLLLMLGGLYLCLEGAEKLAHRFLPHPAPAKADLTRALSDPNTDLVALERTKIRGAIRTDFVLSAEIIVITLGTVQSAALPTRIAVVSGVALLMTVGVYALVAGIVKLDDAGLYLLRTPATAPVGRFLLRLAPWLMKALAVAGTAAMFLVGGGILLHGLPGGHAVLHHLTDMVSPLLPESVLSLLLNVLTGILAGTLAVIVLQLGTAVRRRLMRGR